MDKKTKNERKKNSNVKLIFNKVKSLARKGKFKRALRLLKRVIRLEPEDPLFYYVKAYFLSSLKKYKKLVNVYDQLIEIDPDNISLYHEKTKILINNLNDYSKALKVIKKGLAINPTHKKMWILNIKVLGHLRKFNEICEVFEELFENNMYQPDFHIYI